jgi:hypothetical protein
MDLLVGRDLTVKRDAIIKEYITQIGGITVIPLTSGATALKVRDYANTTDRIVLTEDGNVTVGGEVFIKNYVTASYIIFKDGDYIKARNGLTGQIDFSGTDAATVIQNCINSASSYSKIIIRGDMTLSSINVNKPIELDFHGGVITPVSGYNTISVTSDDVIVRNLKVIGGGEGYRLYIYKGAGDANRIHRITLENVYINGAGATYGFGLYINNVFELLAKYVIVERCGEGCVHIIDSADVDLYSLHTISAGSNFATRIAGCGNVDLFSPIFDSSPLGLTMYNNIEVKIFGGVTLNNSGKGIEILDYNYDVQILGHKIKNNGGNGIEINNPNGGDVKLIGVLSHNNGGYGFNLISCPNLYLSYCNGWANIFGNINNTAGARIYNSPPYDGLNGLRSYAGTSQKVTETSLTLKDEAGPLADKISFLPMVVKYSANNPSTSDATLYVTLRAVYTDGTTTDIDSRSLAAGTSADVAVTGEALYDLLSDGKILQKIQLLAYCSTTPASGSEPTVTLTKVAGVSM